MSDEQWDNPETQKTSGAAMPAGMHTSGMAKEEPLSMIRQLAQENKKFAQINSLLEKEIAQLRQMLHSERIQNAQHFQSILNPTHPRPALNPLDVNFNPDNLAKALDELAVGKWKSANQKIVHRHKGRLRILQPGHDANWLNIEVEWSTNEGFPMDRE